MWKIHLKFGIIKNFCVVHRPKVFKHLGKITLVIIRFLCKILSKVVLPNHHLRKRVLLLSERSLTSHNFLNFLLRKTQTESDITT